jgi:flavin reductase (DIM6/NTAB) family NADH-FMN oxidoreductase RutF
MESRVSRPLPVDREQPDEREPVDTASPTAGPDDLRRIFRRHAAAVTVITTSHRGSPVGLLATSLASVSADPPLISFNVARTSSSWPALEVAAHIGVHVLGAQQEGLADRFARKGADRFSAPTSWRPGPYDIPVIDEVAAWAVAAVEHRFEAGDHVILLARLLHADARDEMSPLVHHDGAYRQVAPAPPRSDNRSAATRLTVIRTGDESR